MWALAAGSVGYKWNMVRRELATVNEERGGVTVGTARKDALDGLLGGGGTCASPCVRRAGYGLLGVRIGEAKKPGPYEEGGSSGSGLAAWQRVAHGIWGKLETRGWGKPKGVGGSAGGQAEDEGHMQVDASGQQSTERGGAKRKSQGDSRFDQADGEDPFERLEEELGRGERGHIATEGVEEVEGSFWDDGPAAACGKGALGGRPRGTGDGPGQKGMAMERFGMRVGGVAEGS